MTKPVKFVEYEGWANQPTWTIMLIINNTQHYCEYYRNLAKNTSMQTVKDQITQDIANFARASYYNGIGKEIADSWLNYGTRCVEWNLVHNKLSGKETREMDEFTEKAYEVMSTAPWKEIIKGAEYRFEADTRLQDWLEDTMNIWLASKDARQKKNSALSRFCLKIIEVCLSVIDWQSVYDDLISE